MRNTTLTELGGWALAALVCLVATIVQFADARRADTAYARGYAAAVDSVRGFPVQRPVPPSPPVGGQFWLGYCAAETMLFDWTMAHSGGWPGPVVCDSLMREGYARFKDGYR